MVKTTDIILGVIAKDLKKSPSDALVVGVAQGADGPVLLSNPLSAKAAESIAGSLKVLGITGAADQVHRLPGLPETGSELLVLAGLGKGLVDGLRELTFDGADVGAEQKGNLRV